MPKGFKNHCDKREREGGRTVSTTAAVDPDLFFSRFNGQGQANNACNRSRSPAGSSFAYSTWSYSGSTTGRERWYAAGSSVIPLLPRRRALRCPPCRWVPQPAALPDHLMQCRSARAPMRASYSETHRGDVVYTAPGPGGQQHACTQHGILRLPLGAPGWRPGLLVYRRAGGTGRAGQASATETRRRRWETPRRGINREQPARPAGQRCATKRASERERARRGRPARPAEGRRCSCCCRCWHCC